MISPADRLREKAQGLRGPSGVTPDGSRYTLTCGGASYRAEIADLLDLLADAWEAMAHERRGASSAACECPCCQVSRRIGEL